MSYFLTSLMSCLTFRPRLCISLSSADLIICLTTSPFLSYQASDPRPLRFSSSQQKFIHLFVVLFNLFSHLFLTKLFAVLGIHLLSNTFLFSLVFLFPSITYICFLRTFHLRTKPLYSSTPAPSSPSSQLKHIHLPRLPFLSPLYLPFSCLPPSTPPSFLALIFQHPFFSSPAILNRSIYHSFPF